MLTLADLRNAQEIVYRSIQATALYNWPLLGKALGTDIWVKHENHTPTGAFKVRGGLVYLHRLLERDPKVPGIVSATRGNHGQSLAFAAAAQAVKCKIVVPYGNSTEKNAAMRAFGAELIEHGRDFDEARAEAQRLAGEEGLHMVPSFHPDLVAGVGSYAMELFSAVPELDVVYVPIGLGSGICGLISARDALGRSTKIVGVVAEKAPAYALSLEAGRVVESDSAATFADGMAVRIPEPAAFDGIRNGVDHIVSLSDDEIAEAMRLYFKATHNIAEGAGAAPLAGAFKEKISLREKKVAVILCGQNIDSDWFAEVLTGGTPEPR